MKVYTISDISKNISPYAFAFLFQLIRYRFNIRSMWEKSKGFAMYALLYHISQTIKKIKENEKVIRYI